MPWEIPDDNWAHQGIFICDEHFPTYGNHASGYALVHELGHALGLYHIFHGNLSSELCKGIEDDDLHEECLANYCDQPCVEHIDLPTIDECLEYINLISCEERSGCYWSDNSLCLSDGDRFGDRCSDTPIITVSGNCYSIEEPNECDGGILWSDIYEAPMNDNYMGYGLNGQNDECNMHFTLQQASRMHAWIVYKLSDWCISDNCDILGCTDENAINYNSYAEIDDGNCEYTASNGDISGDGELNILDIVLVANMVLADEYDEIADVNQDGEINIQDIIILVNIILDN